MKKEIFWTGIIVLAGVLILLFISFYMNKIRISTSKNYVYAVIDNADGVNLHDQVRIRGVKCGYVEKIQIVNDFVVLKLWLNGQAKVTKDSYVGIHDLAIIGGSKYLMVYPGKGDPYEFPKDTIVAKRYDVSFAALGMILDEIRNMVSVVVPEGKKITGIIDSLTKSINGINRIIADNESTVKKTISDISYISENLKITVDSLYPALENINRQIDSYDKSNGTVKRLLNEDSSYIKLNRSIDKLELLLDEMRKNKLIKGCL